MKRFFHENGLTVVILGFFCLSLAGQVVAGHQYYNETQQAHGESQVGYGRYLTSGDFVEAVFENWESEFLQMGLYVLFTMWLRQKGAAESKKLEGNEEVDEPPELHRDDPNVPWPVRRGGVPLAIYKRSLAGVLLAVFVVSFTLHAWGGTRSDCDDRRAHGRACLTVREYVVSARFWFESFQNWQSEFLSLGGLIIMSIWLRQHGSSQSKPVHSPHSKTGVS